MDARDDHDASASPNRRIDTLTERHRNTLLGAIENVCNTEAARTTFAQVIDGVPTVPLLDNGVASLTLADAHPSLTGHRQLCPGMIARLETFRQSFDAGSLPLDSQAMVAYQGAAPGSRLFNTRLIELVSRSIHRIAIELACIDESPHKDKDDGLLSFIPPKSDEVFWRFSPDGPPPTWLHLWWYQDYKQYPNGVNDMIGYWAENHIIGGVLLFDRRQETAGPFLELGGEVDPNGVYIHAERNEVTYRICKLLDTQKKEYLDFLQAGTNDAHQICPLPLMATDDNLVRVDPEEPILETGIYRDSWERGPMPDYAGDDRLRDVITPSDYPRLDDAFAAGRRAKKRQRRIRREELEKQGIVLDDDDDDDNYDDYYY